MEALYPKAEQPVQQTQHWIHRVARTACGEDPQQNEGLASNSVTLRVNVFSHECQQVISPPGMEKTFQSGRARTGFKQALCGTKYSSDTREATGQLQSPRSVLILVAC